MTCIFCKIVDKEIPSEIIYEDEEVIAFKDANPEAPTHFLVIPKKHIAYTSDLTEEDEGLMGHIVYIASKLARQEGLKEGYRIVNNCGNDGGQTVDHLHFHVLGGRNLQWPPG